MTPAKSTKKGADDPLASLREMIDMQKRLPELINTELVRLVESGISQATIATELGLSRQEVSRRYKRLR